MRALLLNFSVIRLLLAGIILVGLGGCAETTSRHSGARILAMGDSMLAWNRGSGKSVAHAVEQELGQPVVDRSVIGARVLYGLPISGSMGLNIAKQYRPGEWDWIVLNGGGNDLWFGCGCNQCERRIDRMISEDGTEGTLANQVSGLRATGAKIIYVGYLRSPGVNSMIESCRDDGDEFEARVARLAERMPGVYFLSLTDLVPHGDRSYHALDMVHPSHKASQAIGERIAKLVREHRPDG